jgi:hypothetical protein
LSRFCSLCRWLYQKDVPWALYIYLLSFILTRRKNGKKNICIYSNPRMLLSPTELKVETRSCLCVSDFIKINFKTYLLTVSSPSKCRCIFIWCMYLRSACSYIFVICWNNPYEGYWSRENRTDLYDIAVLLVQMSFTNKICLNKWITAWKFL